MLEYFKWRWNNADQHNLDCTKAKQWLAEHNLLGNSIKLPNLWLGVSICTPDELWKADELRKIPTAKRFISFEPLLKDMGKLNLEGIDQVIVGGESGPGARPCDINWIYNIVHQCGLANVPVFVKQIHLWKLNWNNELYESEKELRSHYGQECNPKRVLIKDINQFPEDLRRRELAV